MVHAPIRPRAFVALLLGNVALAFGPWLVRLSGVGPASAGLWRLLLAVPFLWVLAVLMKQRPHWPSTAMVGAIAVAAFFFAADLAAWHAGIHLTKLGNATLFGNVASFAFAGWGLWIARAWPTRLQASALILALLGTVLLMVRSAELSAAYLHGDLLSLLAGLLYTGYLIGVERIRGTLQPLPVLILASLFGAAYLLPLALLTGEQIIPADWTGVLLLALGSQVIGQGLLVYALGEVPPLVVGLALLTQPGVSALVGWLVYGERLTLLDFIGAGAIAVALVLVRLRPRSASPS
ncbi:DMT family transporter [Sphingomonas sp. KRR8]|uniref:DMT family transporter n=1 Tax=Sphingomonas sp. KRR8 TaxID=2942996 RepID=UPI00202281DB|nr:DMT family transporter [Sphingomonas sp. KRR8]URD60161.1 DMT family transporter [Sphingomonas sp. KRR8]